MHVRRMAMGLGAAFLLGAPASADPDCAGPENWPASMTFAKLKNDGVLSNDQVDFAHTSVKLIASQKVKADLYRQVFEIAFPLKAGGAVRTVTISDASRGECSMSGVTVYRIVGGGRP